MNEITFSTQRLELCPLSEKELDGPYIEWFNDPEVCKYNSHGERLYTREMAAAYVERVKQSGDVFVWAIYLKQINTHIGNIALQSIDYKNRAAEIAYIIGAKQCWGRGYASEAGAAVVDFAFTSLCLHRLYFGTHELNKGMQRVGTKLGFRKEGILRSAQFKNGSYNDVYLFGLINPNA